MQPCQHVHCQDFPCADVNHARCQIAEVVLDPKAIKVVLISEAAPERPEDHYYADGDLLFQRTTVQAFNDAGIRVTSMRDLLAQGVYATTAVKCAKRGYGVETATVKACSRLLETELALFPNVRALLLMGDVAIKALNAIAKREGQGRVIPAGATYKLRSKDYFYHGRRVFPSYLQAGPAFFIEKSKRRMIAEDIAAAMARG
jgi:uracil-DNA glycosylase